MFPVRVVPFCVKFTVYVLPVNPASTPPDHEPASDRATVIADTGALSSCLPSLTVSFTLNVPADENV